MADSFYNTKLGRELNINIKTWRGIIHNIYWIINDFV